MREIRKIRKRGIAYRKKRRWVLPTVGVAAGIVILAAGGYAYSRWHHPPQETPLAPGMIYMAEKSATAVPPALPAVEATETSSEPEGIPSEGATPEDGISAGEKKEGPPRGKKEETPEKEDQFTFYKTLPAKNDPIVPLTPEKSKKERENAPIYFPPNPSEKGTSPSGGKEGSDGKPRRGEFTIQVAALKDRGGAEELTHALKNKGHEAYILDLPDKERGTLYRVRVGHYANRQEAQRVAERLVKEGLNTFVVKGD